MHGPTCIFWANLTFSLQPVTMAAGDVLLFLGSALTHGAFAWEGEAPRRCAIFFFHAASTALPGGVAGAAHPRL